MITLIKNASLISMNKELEKIEKDIDIKIENDTIVEIGHNISDVGVDKVVDAKGKVVMPGLINTHSHIPMSIFRETVDGYNLQDWLTKKIWPMEDKLTTEDIYYASLLSFIEMIETGCTTANDMYFMTEEIIKAAKETKIRLQTSKTLVGDINDSNNNRLEEYTSLLENYRDKDDLITFNAGIHGLYTTNEESLKAYMDFAKRNNLMVHMHFCENTKEVEDIKNIYNKLPVEVLQNEFKETKTLLAHCVKLDKEQIDVLKQLDISVSHCPVSNLKLGCGVANISKMLDAGVNVSLGTDGQGSGCNLDMFEEMKYAALLQKGITEDPKELPAYEVLKMATINGAKALGLDKEVGSIEIGKKADIIIIDLDNILTQPVNDVFSDIVYNVKGSNVVTTIVNGNILMEDRKTNFNKNEIYNKCKEIIDRISK